MIGDFALELGTFPVHELRWGAATRWRDGVLEVGRDELLAAVRKDARLVRADLELVTPELPARINNVRDVIEPRVKVAGPGMVYPGVCGRPITTVGQGSTHRLAGVGVVESAPIAFYSGNDGWVPGPLVVPGATAATGATGAADGRATAVRGASARGAPTGGERAGPARYVALALEAAPELSVWDQNDAAHAAALLVSDRLAAAVVDLEPPEREGFALPPVAPEVPRVVYIMCLRSPEHYAASTTAWWTAIYGLTRQTPPWLLHPNELLDGAISVRSSWVHANNPVVFDLLRGHGGDCAFAGVIAVRTRWSAQAEKDLTAFQAAKVARMVGARGAIVTWDSGGNDFIEVIRTIQACEQAGVKTVFITGEEPPETGGPPLLEPLPEADAIVSTGWAGALDGDPPPPTPSRIIGGEDQSYDPDSGMLRRELAALAAGARPRTWGRARGGGDRYGFSRISGFEYWMANPLPVVKGVRYVLAHVPGLVRYGSKPARELPRDPALAARLQAHLRSYEAAVAYPPHHVLLGARSPHELWNLPRPWWQRRTEGSGLRTERPTAPTQSPVLSPQSCSARGPFGELMAEAPFYAFLKIVDTANLIPLVDGFAVQAAALLRHHPSIAVRDLAALGDGRPLAEVEAQCRAGAGALPLVLGDGRLAGCIRGDHEADATLTAGVLLENLACKATAVLALRALLREGPVPAEAIEYLLGCGEEAVGDRYQRGGGNLAKAVGEGAGCLRATGADVKAFCCGPVHALVLAASLVAAGLFREVAVVGGGSLAKLGMKLLGHLAHDQPVLEDVLAGVAILVGADDGRSPVLRLDSVGRHAVGAGSSQQAIVEALVAEPLARLGWRFGDVDTYATELHDPEITEPAGSGNVPRLNYRLIAALAALKGEIGRDTVEAFVAAHGLPGFAPTQGHIASAVPFLGHAIDGLTTGSMQRTLFLAKGSLFLGRMTQLADGLSFVLERNPAQNT